MPAQPATVPIFIQVQRHSPGTVSVTSADQSVRFEAPRSEEPFRAVTADDHLIIETLGTRTLSLDWPVHEITMDVDEFERRVNFAARRPG
jgi:hypothetical protein